MLCVCVCAHIGMCVSLFLIHTPSPSDPPPSLSLSLSPSYVCPGDRNAAPWPLCSCLCEIIVSFLLLSFLQPCCVCVCVLVSWALQDSALYWCKPLNSCYISVFGNIPVIELSVLCGLTAARTPIYSVSSTYTYHHRSCQHHTSHLLISHTDAQAWSFLSLSLH